MTAPALKDYGRMVVGGWSLILAATLLSLGAAWLASSLTAPAYTASSRVFLSAPGPSSPRAAMEGNRSSLVRVESYVNLVKSEQVLRRVIVDVGLDLSPEELGADVVVVPTPGSALIDIMVTTEDAEQARDIANSAALNLIQLTEEIDLGRDGPVSAVTLIDAASLPSATSTLWSDLTLGGGVGFAIGAVLVIARGVRRDDIFAHSQVEDIVRDSATTGGMVR
jgi:capsular polysaccharide biosynthesis protein